MSDATMTAQSEPGVTGARVGAVCALLGTAAFVPAGIGFGALPVDFGDLPADSNAAAALEHLAARPLWYWPTIHLGYVFGAFLWFGVLQMLAYSSGRPTARAFGRLAVAAGIVGLALYAVGSAVNAFGLAGLAEVWAQAPVERDDLLVATETLLQLLDGLWAATVLVFHGPPFLLVGLALRAGHRYPAWLGWGGAFTGLGALVVGILLFLGALVPGTGAENLFIAFLSLEGIWITAIGVVMWLRGDAP